MHRMTCIFEYAYVFVLRRFVQPFRQNLLQMLPCVSLNIYIQLTIYISTLPLLFLSVILIVVAFFDMQ